MKLLMNTDITLTLRCYGQNYIDMHHYRNFLHNAITNIVLKFTDTKTRLLCTAIFGKHLLKLTIFYNHYNAITDFVILINKLIDN